MVAHVGVPCGHGLKQPLALAREVWVFRSGIASEGEIELMQEAVAHAAAQFTLIQEAGAVAEAHTRVAVAAGEDTGVAVVADGKEADCAS